MHFQVKNSENRTNNTFRDNETTKKVPVSFLDAKLLSEK